MFLLKAPENPTALNLVARALVWALIMGAGAFLFLYALAFFFGDTDNSHLIALYWGPVTAIVMFAALLVFQIPRAMKMSKGPFFFYLLVTFLPLLGLGGLFLWWFMGTV